jgi:hypothetical protein
VSGGGQTPNSAALGFNVKSDLSGQLNYNADPQGPDAGFSVHCSRFTAYQTGTSTDGFPQVLVKGVCVDKDGNTIMIKATFVDRGTPGKNDSVTIIFSRANTGPLITDSGNLLAGNITIHDDPANPGGTQAEMLSA